VTKSLAVKALLVTFWRMRNFIFIFLFALTFPANAADWSTYSNARFGAEASVPPGFEPTGPEASNSDGLIFRSRASKALLTIFGAKVPGGDFEAFIAAQVAHEEAYNGWTITGIKVTPDWAEISGAVGGRFLSTRYLLSCDAQKAIATRMEYGGGMKATVSKVEASLKFADGSGC
jgi:hypothetical protein